MWLLVFMVMWTTCGFFGYRMHVNFFQKNYPPLADGAYLKDRIDGLLVGLLGPACIIVHVFLYLDEGTSLRIGFGRVIPPGHPDRDKYLHGAI